MLLGRSGLWWVLGVDLGCPLLTHTQIVAHHEALLAQAASVSGMEGLLSSVRQGINELTQSLERYVVSQNSLAKHSSLVRLRLKVRVPYQTLAGLFAQLQKLRQASDVLRRTSRFVTMARRLESQMKEIDGGVPVAATSSRSTPVIGSSDNIEAPASGAGVGDGNAKERAVARAALSVAELCEHIPPRIVISPV
jgi:hypothetical protein